MNRALNDRCDLLKWERKGGSSKQKQNCAPGTGAPKPSIFVRLKGHRPEQNPCFRGQWGEQSASEVCFTLSCEGFTRSLLCLSVLKKLSELLPAYCIFLVSLNCSDKFNRAFPTFKTVGSMNITKRAVDEPFNIRQNKQTWKIRKF